MEQFLLHSDITTEFLFLPFKAKASMKERLWECRACPLHKTRKNPVLGEGNPRAELMFVGEAPGLEEDEQGRPFVGPAGQLLTKMISAMGLKREEIYITNVVKCRPPSNRDPEPEEVGACIPFLWEQIESIRPKVICCLGRISARSLLGLSKDMPLTQVRGRWKELKGIKVLATYHPSFLLRNPHYKREAWEDLKKIMAYLGLGDEK